MFSALRKPAIKYFLTTAAAILAFFCCQFNAMGAEITVQMQFGYQGEHIYALAGFDIPDEYHAYAHTDNAGGKPTRFDFVLENAGVMPVLYPQGVAEPDIYTPDTKILAYKGHIEILTILPAHSSGKLYAATLEMLLCSSRHCIPVTTRFSGQVPEHIPPFTDVPWHEYAENLLKSQAASSGAISLEEGTAPPLQPAEAEEKNDDNNAAKGEPIDEMEGFGLEFSPRYADENVEIHSLGKALLMGLLAGLLLNAMPCVLPVLTLKVSGLLMMGNLDDRQKLRSFRAHNICFAAGIMTLFTALALILGLADLMWGQLYQSQAVLLVLLILVFLMGLSMLGVFTLPAFDLRLGQNTRNPMLQSYLTGLVSTFLATPCSGPLLGGVLAWAFIQPLPVLMAVFWSVGIGMGLPYIAFSIWPGFAHLLPRPGVWMHAFERALGFLLMATALYLLSILPQEKHMQILVVLLLTSFGAWLWGVWCNINAPRWRRMLGNACACIFLVASFVWMLQAATPAPHWQEFTPELFAKDIGKKPMLLEFTADWCPNCKFLEASVLGTKKMTAWQRKYALQLVKVDLTDANPYAEKLLSQLGSRSIPLTALFPVGENSRSPLVLRDIYGADSLEDAIRTAFSPS